MSYYRNQWIPPSERWCVRCNKSFHADDLPEGCDDWAPYPDDDGEIVENPAHVCLDCRPDDDGGDDEE